MLTSLLHPPRAAWTPSATLMGLPPLSLLPSPPLQLAVGPAPTRWTWRLRRRGACARTAWGWPAASCCCSKPRPHGPGHTLGYGGVCSQRGALLTPLHQW